MHTCRCDTKKKTVVTATLFTIIQNVAIQSNPIQCFNLSTHTCSSTQSLSLILFAIPPIYFSSSSSSIFPFLFTLFAAFVDLLMRLFIYLFFKWRGMNFQHFIQSFVSSIIAAYADQVIVRKRTRIRIVANVLLCTQFVEGD